MNEVVRVFISWSGDTKAFAEGLKTVIPRVLDHVDPWISSEQQAGSMWFSAINEQLSGTDVGVVCVSQANQQAQWLNFEAGALSRNVSGKRERMPVLLLDFDSPTDYDGPMSGLQLEMGTETGFINVMKSINALPGGPNIDEDILTDRCGIEWHKLEGHIQKLRGRSAAGAIAHRSTEEKVDEILEIARELIVQGQRGVRDRKSRRSIEWEDLLHELRTDLELIDITIDLLSFDGKSLRLYVHNRLDEMQEDTVRSLASQPFLVEDIAVRQLTQKSLAMARLTEAYEVGPNVVRKTGGLF